MYIPLCSSLMVHCSEQSTHSLAPALSFIMFLANQYVVHFLLLLHVTLLMVVVIVMCLFVICIVLFQAMEYAKIAEKHLQCLKKKLGLFGVFFYIH